MTSASTPAGYLPARRARSTAASVCPARFITPPGSYRKGYMWPGRARSAGLVFGSRTVLMVRQRSVAEIPVVVPWAASIETVNAVRRTSVFLATIIGRSSSSRRSPTIGRQMMPLVCRSIRPTFSGVASSAARMRSPSFSRSSSSTMTTISPREIASMISPIGAKVTFVLPTVSPRTWQSRRSPGLRCLRASANREL